MGRMHKLCTVCTPSRLCALMHSERMRVLCTSMRAPPYARICIAEVMRQVRIVCSVYAPAVVCILMRSVMYATICAVMRHYAK